MHPVLEELKNEIGDAARIAKIDVDQHLSLIHISESNGMETAEQ